MHQISKVVLFRGDFVKGYVIDFTNFSTISTQKVFTQKFREINAFIKLHELFSVEFFFSFYAHQIVNRCFFNAFSCFKMTKICEIHFIIVAKINKIWKNNFPGFNLQLEKHFFCIEESKKSFPVFVKMQIHMQLINSYIHMLAYSSSLQAFSNNCKKSLVSSQEHCLVNYSYTNFQR